MPTNLKDQKTHTKPSKGGFIAVVTCAKVPPAMWADTVYCEWTARHMPTIRMQADAWQGNVCMHEKGVDDTDAIIQPCKRYTM